MGNSGSHLTNNASLKGEQWANSYQKIQSLPSKFSQQHKVLPEQGLSPKLKPTDNGEILQSGGTLTGRQKAILEKNGFQSSNSKNPSRSRYQRDKESPHKSTSHGVQHKLNQNASQKIFNQQMKTFASEPDLRLASSNKQIIKERRPKKKYKAPSPPHRNNSNQKPLTEWEDNSSDNEFTVRRPRLYKTRAETKKDSSHANKPSDFTDGSKPMPSTRPTLPNYRPNRLSLPEMKFADTDEFQKELREATKRLRHISVESQTTLKFDLTNMRSKSTIQVSSKTDEIRTDGKNVNCIRGDASGKESSSQEPSPKLRQKANKPDQSKFFYFGMDERGNSDITAYCTPNLPQATRASSESDISTDSDENNGKVKINLQLRPVLPKKQLEIPRFSPADAWRLLSAIDTNTDVTVASDDACLFVEESIEKCSRPPPILMHLGPRSSHDKSGDSGISGDDAMPMIVFDDPVEHDEAVKQMQVPYKKQERISWTPQQDLDDDSSIEECINSKILDQRPKAGPHLFSLSLPRDNHLASYMIEKSHQMNYSGLEKFKRSLSGVLNHITPKKDVLQANLTDEESVNWFLSKSTPNSMSNGFHSLEMKRSDDHSKSTRIMYLPEINNNHYNFSKPNCKPPLHSKSFENIHVETRESLQDLPINENVWKDKKKSKKFTFQSTIRQLEKRNLSEKLAREAEKREQKRLMELEAMQKVEEEFQRKRDREKANIKQQLRLYRMDEDTAWSSLPPNLEMKNKVRAEPDGAISSSPSPQPAFEKLLDNFEDFKITQSKCVDSKVTATQELSEFKQTEYSYKEYRGKKRYYNEGNQRQTTVHPQVTCHMPKAKEFGRAMSIKKDLAYGVESTMSVSSSYSEDSHHYGKYGPITRF